MLLLLMLVLAAPTQAQAATPAAGPAGGGAPASAFTAQEMPLSIFDAVQRGLDHNLGVLLAEQDRDKAEGTRWVSLSALLPQVHARIGETRQTVNLQSFGFSLPGTPPIIGPFNIFDARVAVSQSVFDLERLNRARADSESQRASRFAYRNARDLVVGVAAHLYLQSLAASARADAARAQLATAEALHRQALGLKQAGLVAGVDVVRADVRLSTERQRATAAESAFQKSKLELARVIGLPIGQRFTVTPVPFTPAPELTLEEAEARAQTARPDLKAAQARVQAAELLRRAVSAERLPTARVAGDYGAIGQTVGGALATYRVAGEVDVPLFQGGRVHGKLLEATADLKKRQAEADDLRAAIHYELAETLLDLKSTEEQFRVATRGRELAELQLTQARDRFAAGLVSNIEIVQAQEAVALAAEQVIGSLFQFNASKVMLARAMGESEASLATYLGGQR